MRYGRHAKACDWQEQDTCSFDHRQFCNIQQLANILPVPWPFLYRDSTASVHGPKPRDMSTFVVYFLKMWRRVTFVIQPM